MSMLMRRLVILGLELLAIALVVKGMEMALNRFFNRKDKHAPFDWTMVLLLAPAGAVRGVVKSIASAVLRA